MVTGFSSPITVHERNITHAHSMHTPCTPTHFCAVGRCSSSGLPLLQRPGQVYLCPPHLLVHHGAGGATTCQRSLQGGPHGAVREAR